MKVRPILFQSDMAAAIAAGRKTETRRVIKPAIDQVGNVAGALHDDGTGGWVAWWPGASPGLAELTRRVYPNQGFRCPYGQPGDLLWVREKWRIYSWDEEIPGFAIEYGDGRTIWRDIPATIDRPDGEYERYWEESSLDCIAGGTPVDDYGCFVWGDDGPPTRWRSSIHMPRWASRLTLRITDVRVERLLHATEAGARAEGLESVADFFAAWDRINGMPASDNPWVWVVAFCLARIPPTPNP